MGGGDVVGVADGGGVGVEEGVPAGAGRSYAKTLIIIMTTTRAITPMYTNALLFLEEFLGITFTSLIKTAINFSN